MPEVSTNKPAEELIYRRSERKAFSKETAIHLIKPNVEPVRVTVSIEDFSPFGIGLHCGISLERGSQFTMQLAPSNGSSADLLYSVAYCQPTTEGQFRIGAEFICIAGQNQTKAPALKTKAEESMDKIRAAILG